MILIIQLVFGGITNQSECSCLVIMHIINGNVASIYHLQSASWCQGLHRCDHYVTAVYSLLRERRTSVYNIISTLLQNDIFDNNNYILIGYTALPSQVDQLTHARTSVSKMKMKPVLLISLFIYNNTQLNYIYTHSSAVSLHSLSTTDSLASSCSFSYSSRFSCSCSNSCKYLPPK